MTMTKQIYRSLIGAGICLGAFACQPEIDNLDVAPGTVPGTSEAVDFSTYVSLGNSLTAGYADGAWYASGQEKSYPALIAQSLRENGLGAKEFNQPTIPSGTIYNVPNGAGTMAGKGQLIITGFTATGTPTFGEVGATSIVGKKTTATGTIHNMGVPGAKSYHLVAPGYGNLANLPNANPMYAYFANNPAGSVADQAAGAKPTFFSLFIGNNDILGYALEGGDGKDVITPLNMFTAGIQGTIAKMKAANGKVQGVLGNVPNILKAPYFTTVVAGLPKLKDADATALNTLRAAKALAVQQVTAVVRSQVETQVTSVVNSSLTQAKAGASANLQAAGMSKADADALVATPQGWQYVAQAIVYGKVFQQAKAAGATDAQADAQAKAYMATAEGQGTIAAITTAGETNWKTGTITSETDKAMAATSTQITLWENVNANYGAAFFENLMGITNKAQALEKATALVAKHKTMLGNVTPETYLAKLKEAVSIDAAEAGKTYLVVEDNGTIRTLKSGELVALPFMSMGVKMALDGLHLSAEEIAAIESARVQYNAVIKQAADANKFAHADIAAFFDRASGGFTYNNVPYSAAFVTGNVFSLDGLHLTQRGAAVLANEFLKAVNSHYKARIPMVDPTPLNGVPFANKD